MAFWSHYHIPITDFINIDFRITSYGYIITNRQSYQWLFVGVLYANSTIQHSICLHSLVCYTTDDIQTYTNFIHFHRNVSFRSFHLSSGERLFVFLMIFLKFVVLLFFSTDSFFIIRYIETIFSLLDWQSS